jgi:hypothetical protein
VCFVRLVEVFGQAALLRHAVAVAVAVAAARRRGAPPRPQLTVHFLPEVEERWKEGSMRAKGM